MSDRLKEVEGRESTEDADEEFLARLEEFLHLSHGRYKIEARHWELKRLVARVRELEAERLESLKEIGKQAMRAGAATQERDALRGWQKRAVPFLESHLATRHGRQWGDAEAKQLLAEVLK